jgi:hypothetical protein
MRFLITAARDPDASKTDRPLDDETFAAYMRFNEEMYKAGVLVAAEGLNPSGARARVVVDRGRRKVVDGPFAESKELVGGFYLVEVKSLAEAVEWALRCPVGLGTDDVLTIEPMTAPSDIPPEYLELIRSAAPTWSEAFARARPGTGNTSQRR